MKCLHVIAVTLIAVIAGCSVDNRGELPLRYSADYTEAFLYLTKNIALAKNTTTEGSEDKTDYSIVKAHWVGKPDVASRSGDTTDENIIPFPKKIGLDSDGKWLLITGDGPRLKTTKHFYAIFLPSEKIFTGVDMQDLQSQLKTNGVDVSSIQLEPLESFFDERVVNHFRPK